VLGLTDAEFFDLTPRAFQLLQIRHKEITVHQELLNGVLASVVANFSMGRPDPPRIPSDYMPSEWQNVKRKPRRKQTKKWKLNEGAKDMLSFFKTRGARDGMTEPISINSARRGR
jgi:hypothetical protein